MEKEPHKDKGWVWRGLILVIMALVLAAVLISFRKYVHRSNSSEADAHQVVDKYANALSIAMQFFDVQKCKTSYIHIGHLISPKFRSTYFDF